MTTDPFTEAMFAASRENNPHRDPQYGEFRAGPEWARAHLAAQEPALRNRIAAEIRAGIAEYPLAEDDPRDDYEIATDRVMAVLAARDVRGQG